MRTQAEIVTKFQNSRGLTDEAFAAELGVTSGAVRHWAEGRRKVGLWIVYQAWARRKSGVAGALLAELMPEFRQAIAERERA